MDRMPNGEEGPESPYAEFKRMDEKVQEMGARFRALKAAGEPVPFKETKERRALVGRLFDLFGEFKEAVLKNEGFVNELHDMPGEAVFNESLVVLALLKASNGYPEKITPEMTLTAIQEVLSQKKQP